jgi:hypothetical protein
LLLSETSSCSQFEIRITFIQICVSQLKWNGPSHYTIATYDLSHSVEQDLNISSNGKLSEVCRIQKVHLYVQAINRANVVIVEYFFHLSSELEDISIHLAKDQVELIAYYRKYCWQVVYFLAQVE